MGAIAATQQYLPIIQKVVRFPTETRGRKQRISDEKCFKLWKLQNAACIIIIIIIYLIHIKAHPNSIIIIRIIYRFYDC